MASQPGSAALDGAHDFNNSINLAASNRSNNTPANENNNVGFRVARLPDRPKETRDVSQV